MDWAEFWATLILGVVFAGTVIGYVFFVRWNNRRGRRIRADFEARGEAIPKRTGLRVVYVLLGVICLVIGFTILNGH